MLNKAIKYGKERRKEYRGSKRFDCTCRNHGSCSYCRSNRLHFDQRHRKHADLNEQLDEYYGYWMMPDPSDAMEDVLEERMKELDYNIDSFNDQKEALYN